MVRWDSAAPIRYIRIFLAQRFQSGAQGLHAPTEIEIGHCPSQLELAWVRGGKSREFVAG
jgi:hypothetical protein